MHLMGHHNYLHRLGNTRLQPTRSAPWGQAPGCTNRRAPILICFSRFVGSTNPLARKDQIDLGISARLQSGLGLFDPLHAVSPGPALRSACLGTAKAGWDSTAFPCSTFITGRVRSTLYTGGAPFASGHVREPKLDRLPFGPSLNQPRVACSW